MTENSIGSKYRTLSASKPVVATIDRSITSGV